MDKAKRLNFGAWVLSALAAIIAITVWGQNLHWRIAGVPNYQLFPVFGLLAFSIMWSHYMVSVSRQILKLEGSVIKTYFEITSYVVLLAIGLHPGLLIWQLYRDGLGLPPGSYEMAYGWVTLLGTGSLFVFIAYEFRRVFGKRSWWRFVGYASDLAMLTIFYHGLRLGTNLHGGWFRWVWYFYGITLLGALAYIHWKKYQTKHT